MLAKAILVHGVIGYKFCCLLPEDQNQGTPAGHESAETPIGNVSPSPLLAQILPFYCTRLDSTLLQYSPAFYLFRCSPGFYHSPVLARILLLSVTYPDSTLLHYSPGFYLCRYSPGPFFGTHPNSTFLRYSPGFYISRYSPGFYPSQVLPWILPFPGTRPDSTIFRYSPGLYLL